MILPLGVRVLVEERRVHTNTYHRPISVGVRELRLSVGLLNYITLFLLAPSRILVAGSCDWFRVVWLEALLCGLRQVSLLTIRLLNK